MRLTAVVSALSLTAPRSCATMQQQREAAAGAPVSGESGDAVTHDNLGLDLAYKGDLNRAIAEFREAIRLNPTVAEAHNNLGVALAHKGDLDGAIAEYREALRLDPNDAVAHKNLDEALKESAK